MPTPGTTEGAPLADVTPNGTAPHGTTPTGKSDAKAEAAAGGEGGAADAAALAEVLPKLTERFAAALVQQLLEKIDRMREVAGETMRGLLLHPRLPRPPHHAELVQLFIDDAAAVEPAAGPAAGEPTSTAAGEPSDDVLTTNGAAGGSADGAAAGSDGVVQAPNCFISASLCYPLFVGLLQYEPYRADGLRGLCVSVGGVTESTMKASSGGERSKWPPLAPSVPQAPPLTRDGAAAATAHAGLRPAPPSRRA